MLFILFQNIQASRVCSSNESDQKRKHNEPYKQGFDEGAHVTLR